MPIEKPLNTRDDGVLGANGARSGDRRGAAGSRRDCRERLGKYVAVAEPRDDQIVACDLAFDAELTLDEPRDRVHGNERYDDARDCIAPNIIALKVRELVHNNRFNSFGGVVVHNGIGQENARPQEADSKRDADSSRDPHRIRVPRRPHTRIALNLRQFVEV